MNIANLIDQAMRDKRITQAKLSKISGVPQATISRTLSGKSVPETATLVPLFAALGLPVALIEDAAGAANEAAPAKSSTRSIALAPTAVTLELDADCLLVWQQLQQLPPDERDRWRALLEIAAGEARLAKIDAKKAAQANPPDKATQRPKTRDPA